jgi:hypothetical protein
LTARQKHAASPAGRKRGSRPKAKRIAPVEYGRESFRLTCRRTRGTVKLPTVNLDELTTAFTWERAGAVMTGTLSFGDPALRRLPGLVRKGDIVRCEIRTRPGAAWRPLWEMTVVTPTRTISARTTELALRSKLAPAQARRGRTAGAPTKSRAARARASR